MLPGTAPSDPFVQKEKEKDERRKIIIALLFLLLSFSCIFCSSQSALWLINRDRVEASMRSKLSADYGFDPALALAPLSEEIISEAEHDEAALLARQTPIAVGLGIAVLPNPIPTPAPTAITLLPTLLPTPTPAAPSNPAPAPATPAAPTATTDTPPTSTPPPSTSAPPATSPPTVPATVPPTAPATVPPTVPATVPPTVPPTVAPTVPSTAVPPTATATPTDTPTATATATNTPTTTPTPTPTDTPTATPTNTPVPPSVEFNPGAYSVGEGDAGNSSVSIFVTLSGPSAITVTVDYATSNQTAEAGSDYTAITGTLTFSPGVISQTFSVSIVDDNLDEPDEIARLTLTNPVNATLGPANPATLTIVDDDTGVGDCAGSYPAGEPNIGPPDADPALNNFAGIACGAGVMIDLGTTPVIVNGDAGTYDLVYYELQGDMPNPPPYYIYMDVVRIEVSQTGADPWFEVFEWGDGTDDTNTNIGGTYTDSGPTSDNTIMTSPPLVGSLVGPVNPLLNTGIQIDVDTVPGGAPPAGTYQYIRIQSPAGGGGGNDRLEVDAIEVLP